MLNHSSIWVKVLAVVISQNLYVLDCWMLYFEFLWDLIHLKKKKPYRIKDWDLASGNNMEINAWPVLRRWESLGHTLRLLHFPCQLYSTLNRRFVLWDCVTWPGSPGAGSDQVERVCETLLVWSEMTRPSFRNRTWPGLMISSDVMVTLHGFVIRLISHSWILCVHVCLCVWWCIRLLEGCGRKEGLSMQCVSVCVCVCAYMRVCMRSIFCMH